MTNKAAFFVALLAVISVEAGAATAGKGESGEMGKGPSALDRLLAGQFQWKVSGPLVAPIADREDPAHAIKDPSVVYYGGRWHLFCTIRSKVRTHNVEYLSFADWKDANKARRHVLKICEGYYCAPQVFWFEPQKKWYMIFQTANEKLKMHPACSTTENIADANSWSAPVPLYDEKPKGGERWIDFWVICDEHKAHLFYTSLDGRMWRAETKLEDFPKGWGEPKVVLQGDVFEASHTYKVKGAQKYITIIEAEHKQGTTRRYFKAYIADSLDGEWRPIAATREKPFASPVNVTDTAEHWTDNFSHGEFLRSGYDQRLEISLENMRLVFQGMLESEMSGQGYGQLTWRLGLLESTW